MTYAPSTRPIPPTASKELLASLVDTEVITASSVSPAQGSLNRLDPTGKGVMTVTPPASTHEFIIMDPGSKWTDTDIVRVVVGADHMDFKLVHQNKAFTFIRGNTSWNVYDGTGAFLVEVNI